MNLSKKVNRLVLCILVLTSTTVHPEGWLEFFAGAGTAVGLVASCYLLCRPKKEPATKLVTQTQFYAYKKALDDRLNKDFAVADNNFRNCKIKFKKTNQRIDKYFGANHSYVQKIHTEMAQGFDHERQKHQGLELEMQGLEEQLVALQKQIPSFELWSEDFNRLDEKIENCRNLYASQADGNAASPKYQSAQPIFEDLNALEITSLRNQLANLQNKIDAQQKHGGTDVINALRTQVHEQQLSLSELRDHYLRINNGILDRTSAMNERMTSIEAAQKAFESKVLADSSKSGNQRSELQYRIDSLSAQIEIFHTTQASEFANMRQELRQDISGKTSSSQNKSSSSSAPTAATAVPWASIRQFCASKEDLKTTEDGLNKKISDLKGRLDTVSANNRSRSASLARPRAATTSSSTASATRPAGTDSASAAQASALAASR